MKTLVRNLMALAVLSLAGYASAATIELDATEGNIVELGLTAGTYQVTLAGEEAWSPWRSNQGCSNGVCERGWLNQYTITFDDTSTLVSDGVRYETEQAASAAAQPFIFSIAADQEVSFQIVDAVNYVDNRGGLTLSVTQVPLPAAAWLFGTALLGISVVARRSRAASAKLAA